MKKDSPILEMLLGAFFGFLLGRDGVFYACILADKIMPSGGFGAVGGFIWIFTIPLGTILGAFVGSKLKIKQPPERPLSEGLDQESECIECSAIIPKGKSECPKCGWTYKNNPNHPIEPIVTTPVDEVEPQSTQAHI